MSMRFSPLNRHRRDDAGQLPTQADLDAVLEKIPVRRLGTIDDVANLAIFLADKDNSYIQGQTILMDGGRTIA